MPAPDAAAAPRPADDSAGPLGSEVRYALLATAAAIGVGMVTERWLGFDQLSLPFITGVLFVAVRTRMAVAMMAAVLAFAAYNFFFFHPRYTFYIEARQGVVTVAIFLLAALVCGRLANHLRSQMLLLRAATARAEALRRLGQRLTVASHELDAVEAATATLRATLDAEAVVLLGDAGDLREIGEHAALRYDPALQLAARQCLAPPEPPVAGADRGTAWTCLPLVLREHAVGVVALRFPTPIPVLDSADMQLADAVVHDLAEALERIRLGRQLEAAHVLAETERLRAALLSSVSHDLRSPLSTIIGSAESLCEYQERIPAADRAALAGDILAEGRRLDRYIQNLLDMTRIGQGPVVLEREWLALDELAGAALARLRRDYPQVEVRLDLPHPAPLLLGNPALLEQALFNVLDNAAKFAPAGAPIHVRAGSDADGLRIEVCDRGPGIPPQAREKVFEKFYQTATGEHGDRRPGGSGLGLSIVRGILDAHGGRVEIAAGDDGLGTCIRLRLPHAAAPTPPPGEDA